MPSKTAKSYYEMTLDCMKELSKKARGKGLTKQAITIGLKNHAAYTGISGSVLQNAVRKALTKAHENGQISVTKLNGDIISTLEKTGTWAGSNRYKMTDKLKKEFLIQEKIAAKIENGVDPREAKKLVLSGKKVATKKPTKSASKTATKKNVTKKPVAPKPKAAAKKKAAVKSKKVAK